MIIDQLFTRPLFEESAMASPEQLAYNKLRAQWDSYQTMTGGGGNTAVSRDPAHAAKLATIPAEIARMAAALKAKGIDAEAQYDALSGPAAAPVDANQAYGGMSEGEYDSRKPFGVRYKVFAGREGRMTTREYWTSSEEKLQRAVDKIQALDNFYEIDGYSYPKESQGVAEGKHFKTAYGWAGGSKPGGGTYKHPDQIKADREAKKKAKEQEQQKNKQPDVGVAEGSEQKPAITYKDYTLQYDYQTEDDDPEGYSTATTYYFDVLKDGDRVGEAEYFDYFGNLTIRINGKTKEFGFRHPLASQISQLVSSLPDEQKKDLSDPRFESQGLTEVFADQGSGSTDRDNADYMKRRNAAKKAGYTGRETKAGTWRVFKDGNAVAVAGPFKSADEAAAWIKKHKQGITEMDKSEPSAGRDTGPRPGPDREAKPITAKKATRDALDMLNRAVKDSHKKKDVKEGEIEQTKTGIRHRGHRYGSGEELPNGGGNRSGFPNPGKYARDLDHLDKNLTSKLDHSMGVTWPHGNKKRDMDESIDPLMMKLKRAMVREGRVKELADDLKTMNDADFMKKYGKAKAAIRKDMKRVDEAPVNELSTNKLAQYKTAAAKDASAADKAGDVKRGDKRFHGMVQATKKQFDNDAKKVDESRAARRALMAQIVNGN